MALSVVSITTARHRDTDNQSGRGRRTKILGEETQGGTTTHRRRGHGTPVGSVYPVVQDTYPDSLDDGHRL